MFKKLIILNVLLMLIFQPIGQAFSASAFSHDHGLPGHSAEISMVDCEQPDSSPDTDLHCCDFGSVSNCEIKNPLGFPSSSLEFGISDSLLGIFSNNKYSLISPDTLLRPPRNT